MDKEIEISTQQANINQTKNKRKGSVRKLVTKGKLIHKYLKLQPDNNYTSQYWKENFKILKLLINN